MTITLRSSLSRDLTATEVDANFTDLNTNKASLATLAASSGSSLVGTIQSGTGAVARTTQDKLRELVSSADFTLTADYTAATPTAVSFKIGGLYWDNTNKYLGINVAIPTGALEVNGTASQRPALKVVAVSGVSQQVEIALVQNEGGLRTYGGYFLVNSTSSDLTWTRRVNNGDTEVFRILNASGRVGITNTTPGTVNGTVLAPVALHIGPPTGASAAMLAIDGTNTAALLINDQAQAANSRLFAIENSGALLKIQAYTDAGVATNVFSMGRTGDLTTIGKMVYGAGSAGNNEMFAADGTSTSSDARFGFRPLSSTTVPGLRFAFSGTTTATIDAYTFTAGGNVNAVKTLALQANGGATTMGGSLTVTVTGGNSVIVDTSAAAAINGQIVIKRGGTTRGFVGTDASDAACLIDTNANASITWSTAKVVLATSGVDIQWGKALVALGGGSAPTLGTIGGSGPASAAQNTWMRVLDSTGTAFFVPAWK